MTEHGPDRPTSLTPKERELLAAIRSAGSLAALAEITGSDTEQDAYLDAKATCRELPRKELGEPKRTPGVPGATVEIDGQPFVVHGPYRTGCARHGSARDGPAV